MYRLYLAILICLKATTAAPQAKESDVTYVKIQPVVPDTPAGAASSIRESRIEKLPLTIPGNINFNSKEPDKNITDNPENNRQNLSENKPEIENKSDLSENLELSESKQSDVFSDASGTTDDLSEISPTNGDLSGAGSEDVSETVPPEAKPSDRRARNFDTTETAEATEYEDELIDSLAEEPRPRVSPKFTPKSPKSSYLTERRVFQSYSSNNLELANTRRFRSKCTCQKIWNCPKLQITIPRCPDEYFLCCV